MLHELATQNLTTLMLSTDELVKSEFLKVSVIHLQVFPVMFSL